MREFISHSPTQTMEFAAEFAKTLVGGEVIAFTGGLGMGKTCFTAGLAKGLGFNGIVTSPTFAIMNEYSSGRLNIYHFDMYRITSFEDLQSCGYFDYLDSGGVLVLEWSENISAVLDEDVIYVNFEGEKQ